MLAPLCFRWYGLAGLETPSLGAEQHSAPHCWVQVVALSQTLGVPEVAVPAHLEATGWILTAACEHG